MTSIIKHLKALKGSTEVFGSSLKMETETIFRMKLAPDVFGILARYSEPFRHEVRSHEVISFLTKIDSLLCGFAVPCMEAIDLGILLLGLLVGMHHPEVVLSCHSGNSIRLCFAIFEALLLAVHPCTWYEDMQTHFNVSHFVY